VLRLTGELLLSSPAELRVPRFNGRYLEQVKPNAAGIIDLDGPV
jgi:hypothetical protein